MAVTGAPVCVLPSDIATDCSAGKVTHETAGREAALPAGWAHAGARETKVAPPRASRRRSRRPDPAAASQTRLASQPAEHGPAGIGACPRLMFWANLAR